VEKNRERAMDVKEYSGKVFHKMINERRLLEEITKRQRGWLEHVTERRKV
jgi:hypothetical protein